MPHSILNCKVNFVNQGGQIFQKFVYLHILFLPFLDNDPINAYLFVCFFLFVCLFVCVAIIHSEVMDSFSH